MLKIGYVRLRDTRSGEDTADLKANGCHVVRAEEPAGVAGDESAVLSSILDFIGEGDQLVVGRLEHLAQTGRGLLEVIDRLEDRGASLAILDPALSTVGDSGSALRAALQAVSALEPNWTHRKRRNAPAAEEIRALQDAGVGPVEIARRLGVSRMTVWRKMRALEAIEVD